MLILSMGLMVARHMMQLASVDLGVQGVQVLPVSKGFVKV